VPARQAVALPDRDLVRIGVIASIAHRLPPLSYGPWEQVASTLTEGFVARGHEVTLFATADSVTAATLHPTAPAGYEEDPRVDAKVWGGLHIAAAFEAAAGLDVLANHFDFLPLTYSRLVPTPVVTTVHGFSSPAILPVFEAYDDIAHYVSISDADRSPLLHYDATIHHGIDLAAFTPAVDGGRPNGPGGHLLFLGRIHPHKGTHHAIEVARRAGLPLVIAGIVQDARYFEEQVQPHLDGERVSYVGAVGPGERDRLLGGAVALLHLIDFDELRLLHPELVNDLPAGAGRLVQRSSGYRATIVAGETVVDDGELTDARPGTLVRGPQALPQ